MTDSADIPFLADVIEARQYDELVVKHVFEAMTDEDVSDVEEYSTGDDWDSDVDNVPLLKFLTLKLLILKYLGLQGMLLKLLIVMWLLELLILKFLVLKFLMLKFLVLKLLMMTFLVLKLLMVTAHRSMYVRHMEHKGKLTAAHQRNLFVELCYSGLEPATSRLDVPKVFQELGYIDPKKARLCIPYQFVPPNIQPQAVAAAKPKPKPKPDAWQLSMNAFLAQK